MKQRRERLGIQQQDLAAYVGITTRSLQHYEAGRRIPRADVAVKIAYELHTTVEKLFGGKGEG